jgi:hypothetical protein
MEGRSHFKGLAQLEERISEENPTYPRQISHAAAVDF